jgi:RAB protein geranylgeranyltransferase component A
VLNTPKVKQIGKIIRAICVLSHPVPNTNDTESNQIIIPYQQVAGRKSDIYILTVSYAHKVCVANKWIAVISTNQESNAAPGSEAEKAEIAPALALLGKVDELFFEVVNNYAPADDGKASQVRNGTKQAHYTASKRMRFNCTLVFIRMGLTRICFVLFFVFVRCSCLLRTTRRPISRARRMR